MRPNGQPVRRKCTVDCFDFSGHATRDSLVNYAVKLNPRQVVLCTGTRCHGVDAPHAIRQNA